MMQWQVAMAGQGLPIMLVLVVDREGPGIVFVPTRRIGTVQEPEQEVRLGAWWTDESFTLMQGNDEEDFFYNTVYRYKNIPLLLKYLQQQEMISPF